MKGMAKSMFLVFALVLAFLLATAVGGDRSAYAAEAQGKKILVAWFSRTGTTHGIAELIHAQVGGDIVEIKAADPYPADDKVNQERLNLEKKSDARPELAMELQDLVAYDVIFIGHPIWQGELPPVLLTFLEKYDFSDKTVIPFCTFGGSGAGETAAEIAKRTPNSEHLEGLGILASEAGNAQGKVAEWLRKIGMTK